uniref:Tectonic-1-3 N-terminal domain-containing protein n=1 Tax=Anopheles funestus TaxID=62324 RepID=A0A182RC04_ANOFN
MVSNCINLRMVTTLLWLWLILFAPCIEGGERNIQHFVKIDVAKINIKNTTDTVGNVSSTTLTSEPVTESSTKPSTTEGTTTSASSPTTSKTTATETTVTTESTSATSTSTAMPTSNPTEVSYPSFKAGRAAKLVPKGYYCRCDLTINVCDINCCCDIDCNVAILRTYNCDQEQLHADEYHHGEGLQSCRVQGGLFCLVEPIYEEGDDNYYNPGKLSTATRHKWKEVFPLENPASSEDIRFDHYRVDDVIYVYNETSELVQLFALPVSLAGGVCHIEQPVRFLQDRTNLCRRTVDELSEFNRAFFRHTSASVRFFRTPKKSTVMEHYCVEEGDCLNATISVCYYTAGDGWNCSLANANITDATASVDEAFEEDPGTICRELEMLFYHNYTNLQRVQMKLLCRPAFPDGELSMENVWQRIIVKFIVLSANTKTDLARAVSGNIGYLVGKPLIVSHLELVANGTIPPEESPSENPPKRMLAYFTNGTRLPDASFRLRIPISRRNHCVLTEEYHQTIDFGTDMFHRSEGYDKLNLYVSKYGNPINRTTEWVRVRSTNFILEAEPGSDSSEPNTDTTDGYFTCSNMLINVEYRYYYARTRVRDVRHQAIVHDAEIVFGPRVNLRFRLDEEIRVPIFIQVQFFDLTSSTVAVVAGLSDLLIRFGALFYVLSVQRRTSKGCL